MVYIVIIIKKNKTYNFAVCSLKKKKWIHYEWWADLRTTAR